MTICIEEIFKVRQEQIAIANRALIEVLRDIYRGRGTHPSPHIIRIKAEADELSEKKRFAAANELYDFIIDEMRAELK